MNGACEFSEGAKKDLSDRPKAIRKRVGRIHESSLAEYAQLCILELPPEKNKRRKRGILAVMNAKNKVWNVSLRSKKEPERVEAATVQEYDGRVTFVDAQGNFAASYSLAEVQGYSIEADSWCAIIPNSR